MQKIITYHVRNLIKYSSYVYIQKLSCAKKTLFDLQVVLPPHRVPGSSLSSGYCLWGICLPGFLPGFLVSPKIMLVDGLGVNQCKNVCVYVRAWCPVIPSRVYSCRMISVPRICAESTPNQHKMVAEDEWLKLFSAGVCKYENIFTEIWWIYSPLGYKWYLIL